MLSSLNVSHRHQGIKIRHGRRKDEYERRKPLFQAISSTSGIPSIPEWMADEEAIHLVLVQGKG